MAYITVAGTTTAMAQEYTEDAPAGMKADAYLRDAERIVANLTTRPDPVTNEYTQAASDAELRVFEALVQRPDRISSQSLGSMSVSYNNAVAADLYDIVRDTMGAWLNQEANGAPVVTVTEVPYY